MGSLQQQPSKARSCVGKTRSVRLALAGLAAMVAAPAIATENCQMAETDQIWLSNALDQWEISAQRNLGLEQVTLPTVFAIDGNCTFILEGGDWSAIKSEPHGDQVTIPDAPTLPIGPISFAFGNDKFVMSLPSVWREAGVSSEFGLEHLMTGVLLHEIMHTMQSDLVTDVLEPIAAEAGLAEELSDDLLQERFQSRADYAAAYREELDTLFTAATVPDEAGAKALAAYALHLMRDRHRRWLSGANAHFADFDGGFLTMEGTGQWLIYRYFLSLPQGRNDPDGVMKAVRRGGNWWSQDEGLALILTVDRLLPGWQERIFREPDWRAENLLAAAISH